MKPPTILDYIHSLFDPNRRIDLDEFFNEDNPERINEKTLPSSEQQQISGKKEKQNWSIFIALGCALLAQLLLEPGYRNEIISLILYCLSSYFCWKSLIWQSCRDEIQNSTKKWSILKIRYIYFFISIIFLSFSFIKFNTGLFNKDNLFPWIAGISFFLMSILEPSKHSNKTLLNRKESTLLFGIGILVFTLALFMRFYQLNGVPLEMFSDHAEKLLDIQDVLDGNFPVFFERNTGREAIQFYLTAAIIRLFITGINFLSLKLGMAIVGILTLLFIFLLGCQLGGKWVGIISMALAGVGYWPNVISRVGLRYALYPLFSAASLFFLFKGLQEKQRNHLVVSGLLIGVGLYGYSPFRIVPLLVVMIFMIYAFDQNNDDPSSGLFINLAIIAFSAFTIFIPLFRYTLDHPGNFSYRAITRLTGAEQAISGPLWIVFINNFFKAITMFFNNNGVIWVHSVPNRPALDIFTAALYFLGTVYLVIRFFRYRKWEDAALVISIPILMMPSILSLAFPDENPSLNRTSGAYPFVFVIAAIGFFQVVKTILDHNRTKAGKITVFSLSLGLVAFSIYQNYDLVFNQYAHQYELNAWNTSEIGHVMTEYWTKGYAPENTIVVPFPHWVDTRLVGICAGKPRADFALWPDDFDQLKDRHGPKLIIAKPEDTESLEILKGLFPESQISRYYSKIPGKDFLIFQTSN